MAYDEHLADRVRAVLDDLLDGPPAVEKKMFGGLALMVEGSLACGVVRDGLMVRVDPAAWGDAMAEPGAHPLVMQRRPTRGWVVVDEATCADDAALRRWVGRGVDRARALRPA